jgi:dynein heavy chain
MADVKNAEAAEGKPNTAKGKKGDEEGGEQIQIQIDARINWFEDRVCNALKIKNDKWKKMTQVPENL